MKKNIFKIGIGGLLTLPAFAFAAKDLEWLINNIIFKYLDYGLKIIMALAIVMFVWNIYQYFIAKADSPGEKKEAGQYLLWSLVGFFVILSVWGLVNILLNTFKLDNDNPSGFFPKFNSPSSPDYGGQTTINNGQQTSNNNSNSLFKQMGPQ